jgi:predicted restriction endonuclease
MSSSTPQASDISGPGEITRIKTEVYRILRDTALARDLKLLHRNRCQICGITLTLQNGDSYSEAHHIRPLGSPHNGPDIATNIIILCPNCHVKCDYGAIPLQLDKLYSLPKHSIGTEYVSHHNAKIYKA